MTLMMIRQKPDLHPKDKGSFISYPHRNDMRRLVRHAGRYSLYIFLSTRRGSAHIWHRFFCSSQSTHEQTDALGWNRFQYDFSSGNHYYCTLYSSTITDLCEEHDSSLFIPQDVICHFKCLLFLGTLTPDSGWTVMVLNWARLSACLLISNLNTILVV